MFNFDLKGAAIFRAVKWARNPFFVLARFLKRPLIFLFSIFLILFLYGFFTERFSNYYLSNLLGISILSLTVSLIFWLVDAFLNSKLKNPFPGNEGKKLLDKAIKNPQRFNLAEFLDFGAAKVIWQATNFCRKKNLSQIQPEVIFYFALEEWPDADIVFSRALLDFKGIKKGLKNYLDNLKGEKFQNILSEDSQRVILDSAIIAQKRDRGNIGIGDIIISQSKIDKTFVKYLVASDIKTEDIENLIFWLESLDEKIIESKKWWGYKNLAKKGSIAKEWSAGYTILLDRFAIDWTEVIKKRGFEEIIGHKKTIEQIERVLARSDINNALLIGEPGSGRGSIIQAIAQKSLFGESLPPVNYKRVVELDMTSLLAQIENPEEVENILDNILKEIVSAGNIILVINEFHNFVGQLVRPGIVDISGVLAPYLKSPKLQIVAVTTYTGLHKYIEQNPSILSLFEKVEVIEISEGDTLLLLQNLALSLEKKYKRFVTYRALREIIFDTAKYMPTIPFPKKAMDILDEVMIYVVQSTKDKLVLPEHVAKIISDKTQIPVGEVGKEERDILLNLENLLHQRIINQEEAVTEVATAMRRARAEVTIRKGPMGAFLFLGPTGVGKTETSKALAEIYFGSEEKMIRLDMSEFQTVGDISRLIGSPEEEGLLTTKVRENPFSLILLDEIEKAHTNILNLFLQVFDEGHLTDGLGRKVDFKNTLIISTSNAGYQIILEALKRGKLMSSIKEELIDFLFKEVIFKPEFINRFDSVVVFKSLTKDNLLGIAGLLLNKLKKNLENKGIEFEITEELKEKIVELGYSPVFGAREMRRVIQDKVENVLANALLSGEIKRGDRIEMNSSTFQLKK